MDFKPQQYYYFIIKKPWENIKHSYHGKYVQGFPANNDINLECQISIRTCSTLRVFPFKWISKYISLKQILSIYLIDDVINIIEEYIY